MSDTPRTDEAVIAELPVLGVDTKIVTAAFAKKLEREITRLRLALTGVSTCSSCEICRNVALKALE